MTASKLRKLAEALERGFMTEADRKGWVSDLRAHAKAVDESVMMEVSGGIIITPQDAALLLQLPWPRNWPTDAQRRLMDLHVRLEDHAGPLRGPVDEGTPQRGLKLRLR